MTLLDYEKVRFSSTKSGRAKNRPCPQGLKRGRPLPALPNRLRRLCSRLMSTPDKKCVHFCQCITSLPKVIWEEGRVAALSDTYAVKSPLVPMARPKFAPSREPIPKPHYLPYPWTRPTYDAKRLPDPIRRFSTMHWTDRPTDRPRESLTTTGRCAPTATRPNNTRCTYTLCGQSNSKKYVDAIEQNALSPRVGMSAHVK